MKNYAVKIGLLTGLGTILFLLLIYWIDKKLALNPNIIWFTTLFYLIGMYKAAAVERKKANEYLGFRPALRVAFLVFIIANAIYHFYNYLLFNFLDPKMLDVQIALILGEGGLDNLMNEEQRATFLKDIMIYDFKNMTFAYFSSLIGGFILAVIIALIVKREPLQS